MRLFIIRLGDDEDVMKSLAAETCSQPAGPANNRVFASGAALSQCQASGVSAAAVSAPLI